MKKIIFLLLSSLFIMSVRVETAHAVTCKVGGRGTGKGHYNRIQRAIDSGTCSLILLHPTTYYENLTIPERRTIVLSSALDSSLTEHGAEPNAPIIDGRANAPVIIVGTGATLIIENVVLQNGFSTAGAAINSPYPNSSIELTHVSVVNNFVETGGAIWSIGNISITFSLFADNLGSSYYSSYATALSIDVENNENVIIENSTFSNNIATNDGPAVSISTAGTSTLTLNDNIFENNQGYSCAAVNLYLADYTVKSMISNLFDMNMADPTNGLGAVCATVNDPVNFMFIETDNFYSSNTPSDIYWY